MAMDVDEDEDATQRPKQVQDYGIEIDFETLDEDDREVRFIGARGPNSTNVTCTIERHARDGR